MEYGIRDEILDNMALMLIDFGKTSMWKAIMSKWVELYREILALPKEDRPGEVTLRNHIRFDEWLKNFGSKNKQPSKDVNVISNVKPLFKR